MPTATPQRRIVPIRNLGHARAVLVALDHVPSLFGGREGDRHMHSTCQFCGRKAWVSNNRMAGGAVDERCPSSGWPDSEEVRECVR